MIEYGGVMVIGCMAGMTGRLGNWVLEGIWIPTIKQIRISSRFKSFGLSY